MRTSLRLPDVTAATSRSARAAAPVAVCVVVFLVLVVALLVLGFGALRELQIATGTGSIAVYDGVVILAAWGAVRYALRLARNASVRARIATAVAPAVVFALFAVVTLGNGAGVVRVVVNLALLVAVGLLEERRSDAADDTA